MHFFYLFFLWRLRCIYTIVIRRTTVTLNPAFFLLFLCFFYIHRLVFKPPGAAHCTCTTTISPRARQIRICRLVVCIYYTHTNCIETKKSKNTSSSNITSQWTVYSEIATLHRVREKCY